MYYEFVKSDLCIQPSPYLIFATEWSMERTFYTLLVNVVVHNNEDTLHCILNQLFLWFVLKVLDQITLKNKFCLNFKTRSVFI